MFQRSILSNLKDWKSNKNRKPLLLHGARQTGKTWILKEFGKVCFDDMAYFSLDKEDGVSEIFQTTKDPKRIIQQLSFLHGREIVAGTSLLILDEIQECPDALKSLKYFCEEMPEIAVACAGSLLGVYLNHANQSFPVGKVDHIYMYPLTFSEFLQQKDLAMYNYYIQVEDTEPLPQIFFDKLYESYIAFCVCGGMPEAAGNMIGKTDIKGAENILGNILQDYSHDFVKHTTPALANKIDYVWQSLPSQLARENRKFLYQLVRPGARAREYEDAITWLEHAGLVYRVNACKRPALPIKAYDDLSAFKVYCADIGVLRILSEMPSSVFLSPTPGFKEFKGAFAENYVLQSLKALYGGSFRYWASGNKAEVEFLLVHDNIIIPVEVKADRNITGKSLIEYGKAFSPKLRIRYSLRNLKLDGNLLNIPIFMTDRTEVFLRKLISKCLNI